MLVVLGNQGRHGDGVDDVDEKSGSKADVFSFDKGSAELRNQMEGGDGGNSEG